MARPVRARGAARRGGPHPRVAPAGGPVALPLFPACEAHLHWQMLATAGGVGTRTLGQQQSRRPRRCVLRRRPRSPRAPQFVDLPGADRLGMDPEVLRLREGVSLNRSLVALAGVVRGGARAAHAPWWAAHARCAAACCRLCAAGGPGRGNVGAQSAGCSPRAVVLVMTVKCSALRSCAALRRRAAQSLQTTRRAC